LVYTAAQQIFQSFLIEVVGMRDDSVRQVYRTLPVELKSKRGLESPQKAQYRAVKKADALASASYRRDNQLIFVYEHPLVAPQLMQR
jgi:predicted Zn-dependent protease